MHELGVALEVLEIVAARSDGARVRRVVLEIGKLAAVLPDAVRFAFELASEGTVAEGAALEIVETAGRARCRECRAVFDMDGLHGSCACGSSSLEWLAGTELKVREMEVA